MFSSNSNSNSLASGGKAPIESYEDKLWEALEGIHQAISRALRADKDKPQSKQPGIVHKAFTSLSTAFTSLKSVFVATDNRDTADVYNSLWDAFTEAYNNIQGNEADIKQFVTDFPDKQYKAIQNAAALADDDKKLLIGICNIFKIVLSQHFYAKRMLLPLIEFLDTLDLSLLNKDKIGTYNYYIKSVNEYLTQFNIDPGIAGETDDSNNGQFIKTLDSKLQKIHDEKLVATYPSASATIEAADRFYEYIINSEITANIQERLHVHINNIDNLLRDSNDNSQYTIGAPSSEALRKLIIDTKAVLDNIKMRIVYQKSRWEGNTLEKEPPPYEHDTAKFFHAACTIIDIAIANKTEGVDTAITNSKTPTLDIELFDTYVELTTSLPAKCQKLKELCLERSKRSSKRNNNQAPTHVASDSSDESDHDSSLLNPWKEPVKLLNKAFGVVNRDELMKSTKIYFQSSAKNKKNEIREQLNKNVNELHTACGTEMDTIALKADASIKYLDKKLTELDAIQKNQREDAIAPCRNDIKTRATEIKTKLEQHLQSVKPVIPVAKSSTTTSEMGRFFKRNWKPMLLGGLIVVGIAALTIGTMGVFGIISIGAGVLAGALAAGAVMGASSGAVINEIDNVRIHTNTAAATLNTTTVINQHLHRAPNQPTTGNHRTPTTSNSNISNSHADAASALRQSNDSDDSDEYDNINDNRITASAF